MVSYSSRNFALALFCEGKVWYTKGSISCLRHPNDQSGTRPEAGRTAEKERSTMREYISHNEAETEKIGGSLAARLQAGAVLAYRGGLGAGKTAFTRGLAKGLGYEGRVTSPTFTIVQEYGEGRLPFYHFDVYRIGDVEEMEEVGYEDCFYGEGVCLIEWADLIEEILPREHRRIIIEKDLSKGFDYRRITIEDRGRTED